MILAVTLALAVDRPMLDAPADDLCPPRGLRSGAAYTPACDGVALSLARSRWYAEMVVWADEQAAMRRLESAACMDDVERVAERADYWRGIAERPAPVVHPAVVFGVGVLGGVALTVGAGWALGQVAGD